MGTEIKNKSRTKKMFRTIVFSAGVLISVMLIIIIFITIRNFEKQKQEISAANNSQIKINGKVLAESQANIGGFKSDNYNVPQISFGGEGTIYYPSNEEQLQLAIADMKSEIYTDKNKTNKKLLVSWETSKPTRCILTYSKIGGAAEKQYQETNFGYDHTALLTPLDPATTYNYTVVARDKWGNEMSSDKFAIYTGAQEVSFLDLLAGAFKDVFGWATKR